MSGGIGTLGGGTRPIYASAECEIDLARRELRIRGSAVSVGGRAFGIIEVLVQSAGELVTKKELMDRIWPGAIVLDGTLRVHTTAVRKALGPYRNLLKTEAGRGYRLLGDWTVQRQDVTRTQAGPQQVQAQSERPVTNLPMTVTRLFGRSEAVARLRDLISAYRVVTLTGPGGIGKTSLALKVSRCVLGEFADGGWLVELASLSDPGLVPSAVARALELTLIGGEPSAEAVARAISAKQLLLLLDNCEHVIDAAAILAETVSRLCPHVTIMATSREVLRMNGEYVYHVPPLDVPVRGRASPDDILGHSAVELFIDRTTALDSGYPKAAGELAMVASICRHLDGIPLAIEFAAAIAATLDIHTVADRLANRFALLRVGRRTALPRHQTLRAALDWSHDLLPDVEKTIFRRLAVFRGDFSRVAVELVVSGPGLTLNQVSDGIVNLVSKSLVSVDISRTVPCFRLLETIRAYALEKLEQSGELNAVGRSHAAYFTALFRDAEADAESGAPLEWGTNDGPLIDNCRAALDWAFALDGDIAIGLELTAMATPFWVRMSLMSEFRRYVERALADLPKLADRNERVDMMLHAALGACLTYTTGPVPETYAAWSRTLLVAERRDDSDFRLRALRGLWSYHMNLGEYREALARANEFCALAGQLAKLPTLRVGNRMVGLLLHYLGEQTEARQQVERSIGGHAEESEPALTAQFMLDHAVAAHALLARILWLQGCPGQAMRLAEHALEQAEAAGHVISRCHALAQAACPVALWTGNLAAAEQFVTKLIGLASDHLLEGWIARGRCFSGMLAILGGDAAEGSDRLRNALLELPAAGSTAEYPAFLAALAHGLKLAGQIESAEAAIDEAINWSETTGERWCAAELLRIQAEILLTSGAEGIEHALQRSLAIARGQGALSWELRAATDLARLWQARGRAAEASIMLAPIYARFSEGFETADLQAAGLLIHDLATHARSGER